MTLKDRDDLFMQKAVEEAKAGIEHRHGGPFGSIVVKDGAVVGTGHNRVLIDNDPTAHGEIEAIRDACKNLKTHNLEGCTLYTTCYPCPMCACACMWANIGQIVYGCSQEDADAIGFRDDEFYNKIMAIDNVIAFKIEDTKACTDLFNDYVKSTDVRY